MGTPSGGPPAPARGQDGGRGFGLPPPDPRAAGAASDAYTIDGRPFVGIQIGAVSFVDEGTADVLDLLRERAGVNAVLLACHTFDRGTGGRQLPGHPLPDHGGQQYDDFRGGSFTAIHPQYYARTVVGDFRAPAGGQGEGAEHPPAFHRNLARTIFGDARPEASLELMYGILGVDEAPLDALPATAWSAEYVRRETVRAVTGAGPGVAILPGIDIDVPTGEGQTRCTPEGTREAVKAAFAGGARGVILSRKYSEMRLANLFAVQEALAR